MFIRRRALHPWKALPRWARRLVLGASGIVLAKLAVQALIQIRPRITPPACGFLLDSPLRMWYRGSERTLRPLQLAAGQRVLEVGGGTGAFTMLLGHAVGPAGGVYSIELQKGMLARQKRRVRAHATPNVWLHQADALALPFTDASFDRAVLIACLPMLPDKQRALLEIRRVLRPGGLLAVSEEIIEPEYVPLAVTRAWCRRAGFQEVGVQREALFYTLVSCSIATYDQKQGGPL